MTNTYPENASWKTKILEEIRCLRCVNERILRVMDEGLFVDYQMEKFRDMKSETVSASADNGDIEPSGVPESDSTDARGSTEATTDGRNFPPSETEGGCSCGHKKKEHAPYTKNGTIDGEFYECYHRQKCGCLKFSPKSKSEGR